MLHAASRGKCPVMTTYVQIEDGLGVTALTSNYSGKVGMGSEEFSTRFHQEGTRTRCNRPSSASTRFSYALRSLKDSRSAIVKLVFTLAAAFGSGAHPDFSEYLLNMGIVAFFGAFLHQKLNLLGNLIQLTPRRDTLDSLPNKHLVVSAAAFPQKLAGYA
jgi:hypothetical protein